MRDLKDSIKLDAVIGNFDAFMDFIDLCCIASEIDKKAAINLLTACDEIVANIIHYAYPEAPGSLEILFASDEQSVTLTFIDNGQPFNPLEKPDADVSVPLENRPEGGLGILMVKHLMDDVRYEYRSDRNYLTVIKHGLR